MADRAGQITVFLSNTEWADAGRRPLAGDASARRYLRLTAGGRTAVLMDAPPATNPDVGAFLRIARHLTGAGFSAPRIIKADRDCGLVLLEDFGDGLFARLIETDPGCEEMLYAAAVDLLADLRSVAPPDGLKILTPDVLAGQISPVFDWYRRGICGDDSNGRLKSLQGILETVLRRVLDDPDIMILRDYHAENLIWLPDREGAHRVGLLDFQDAMIGHAAYDLVSLLQDARRDVSRDLADAMIARFTAASGLDPVTFSAGFHVLGAQRNLRILGIFARLSLAHGRPEYIDLIARVWGHLMTCLSHPDLAPVAARVRADLPEPTPANLQILRDRCATVLTP